MTQRISNKRLNFKGSKKKSARNTRLTQTLTSWNTLAREYSKKTTTVNLPKK